MTAICGILLFCKFISNWRQNENVNQPLSSHADLLMASGVRKDKWMRHSGQQHVALLVEQCQCSSQATDHWNQTNVQ
jgi:hypothetical protein